MKGWRTILFNVLGGGGITVASLSDLLPPKYQWLGAAILAASNVYLRTVTNTPVGQPTPAPKK